MRPCRTLVLLLLVLAVLAAVPSRPVHAAAPAVMSDLLDGTSRCSLSGPPKRYAPTLDDFGADGDGFLKRDDSGYVSGRGYEFGFLRRDFRGPIREQRDYYLNGGVILAPDAAIASRDLQQASDAWTSSWARKEPLAPPRIGDESAAVRRTTPWEISSGQPMIEVFLTFRLCNATVQVVVATLPKVDALGLAVRYARGIEARMRGGVAASPTSAPGCPPGDRTGFRASDRLVMTYFYYWYEPRDLGHPSLNLHPPAGASFDWRDIGWYERQLADMAAAGVDVVLPVSWGDRFAWSTEGLRPLVAARERLLGKGIRPPAIGLFLDSNLYSYLMAERRDPRLTDLRTGPGLATYAAYVADFFERIPACHRARFDDRPLAFLWRPDTEDGHVLRFDGGTFPALYAALEQRLGQRPYLIRERTWDEYGAKNGFVPATDGQFAWGAALAGPLRAGATIAVGPGYDDRLVEGRTGLTRAPNGGQTYASDLQAALTSGAPWLLLETWNELWEGTAIAETRETGRTYLDLTRRYTRLFHQGGS